MRAAKYPLIAVMDSDMQHHPRYLPKLIREIENGADMVIGSRYAKGGCFKKLPLARRLLSQLSIQLTKPLTSVHDPLGQFYVVRKSAIKHIDFARIGFRLSLEIMVKGTVKKIAEVPIIFQKRFTGKSKLNFQSAFADLALLAHLYSWKTGEILSLKPHPRVATKYM
jgi:dolichol-phosphate mannosyltransferase